MFLIIFIMFINKLNIFSFSSSLRALNKKGLKPINVFCYNYKQTQCSRGCSKTPLLREGLKKMSLYPHFVDKTIWTMFGYI